MVATRLREAQQENSRHSSEKRLSRSLTRIEMRIFGWRAPVKGQAKGKAVESLRPAGLVPFHRVRDAEGKRCRMVCGLTGRLRVCGSIIGYWRDRQSFDLVVEVETQVTVIGQVKERVVKPLDESEYTYYSRRHHFYAGQRRGGR
jgi:hypothetical protein